MTYKLSEVQYFALKNKDLKKDKLLCKQIKNIHLSQNMVEYANNYKYILDQDLIVIAKIDNTAIGFSWLTYGKNSNDKAILEWLILHKSFSNPLLFKDIFDKTLLFAKNNNTKEIYGNFWSKTWSRIIDKEKLIKHYNYNNIIIDYKRSSNFDFKIELTESQSEMCESKS